MERTASDHRGPSKPCQGFRRLARRAAGRLSKHEPADVRREFEVEVVPVRRVVVRRQDTVEQKRPRRATGDRPQFFTLWVGRLATRIANLRAYFALEMRKDHQFL